MFSIVVPLYNKEFSILNTIQSVLNQTNPNFEIIIVDDGSTDNSVQLLKQLNDKRIRLIQQKNKGVSAARNRGINEAKYEWVAFLDADDLWKPTHLEEVVYMMSKYPKEMVYVTSFEYSDNRSLFKYPRKSDVFEIDNYFKEVMKERLLWTSSVTVNKACFKKIGGFNININRGEDLDMWARLAKNYKIIKSAKVTSTYNLMDENSLTKRKSNIDNSILTIIDLKNKNSYERKYFKRMIYSRIKQDIKDLDLRELYKIVRKYNIELFK